MDRDFLAKFIRAKKYNVESAAAAFQKYYAHIFRNLRRLEGIKPSHFAAAFASRAFVVFKHSVNGSRILLLQAHAWDPSEVKVRDLINAALLLCEELLKDITAKPYYGGIIVINLAGLSFGHLKQCSPSEIKYAVSMALVSNSMSLRYRSLETFDSIFDLCDPNHREQILEVSLPNAIQIS